MNLKEILYEPEILLMQSIQSKRLKEKKNDKNIFPLINIHRRINERANKHNPHLPNDRAEAKLPRSG